MSELNTPQRQISGSDRHRDRLSQIPIYLGKLLRSFIYQSDWKLLPMCAIIAALVSMVIRRGFGTNMEGSLKGSFALACVAIWNGSFNSIQSIVRERGIVKREHRSGMHITSYVIAHMIYQALLCAVQAGITVYVGVIMKINFPKEGLMTPIFELDLGITLFLISYAADMISLLISSIAKTTTGAMTVMPFLLIFQLVFSGGIFNLPNWTRPISRLTISNYGLKCINAQMDYNNQPMTLPWEALQGMKDMMIEQDITSTEILEILSREDNASIAALRSLSLDELSERMVVALTEPKSSPEAAVESSVESVAEVSVESVAEAAVESVAEAAVESVAEAYVESAAEAAVESVAEAYVESAAEAYVESAAEAVAGTSFLPLDLYNSGGSLETLGDVIDLIKEEDEVLTYHLKMPVSDLIDIIGEKKVENLAKNETAKAYQNPAYDRSMDNIEKYWLALAAFVFVFAFFTVVSLEFIDKDKR